MKVRKEIRTAGGKPIRGTSVKTLASSSEMCVCLEKRTELNTDCHDCIDKRGTHTHIFPPFLSLSIH